MGLLGFLSLSLGLLVVACSSKCVPETAECVRYWVKMEPHKNLMEDVNELNTWCSKQRLFYGCVEEALSGSENSSELPVKFLISKMFSEDLCLEESLGRKRYLDNAACINQLNTEYCTLPEYLDIVTPDDAIPSRCSLSEKTFSCIAATMISNCGFDAGRVYRYLLKLTTYSTEVCDSENTEDSPPCGDMKSSSVKREEGLSEIYYGLLNRFGVIPEQAADEQSHFPGHPDTAAELLVNENEESLLSEVIRNALDSIDEEPAPEQYGTVDTSRQPEYLQRGSEHGSEDQLEYLLQGAEHRSEDQTEYLQRDAENAEYGSEDLLEYLLRDAEHGSEDQPEYLQNAEGAEYGSKDKSYKRNPIIAEPFNGLLHYNYSGREYAIYWRQPNDFPIENVECEHLLPSFLSGVIFRCLVNRRLSDPDCIAPVEEDEPLTPELIRDIDPDVPHDSTTDFGPRPYWMAEIDEYKRLKDSRVQSTAGRLSTSSETSTEESPFSPASCTSDTLIIEMMNNPNFKWWKCPSLFSEELRKEIVSVLLPDLKEDDIPLMSAFHSSNVAYVYLYEERVHDFERIVCERVNECHPRGRGVFRCTIIPREIKQCYNCYEESHSASPAFDTLRIIPSTPSEVSSEAPDSSIMDSSGDSEEYEPLSDEFITLLIGGDEKPVPNKGDADTEDIVAEEDDLVAIDISDIAEPSKTDTSSGVAFMLLDEDVKLQGDEAGVVAYSVHESDGLADYEDYQNGDFSYQLTHDEPQPLNENVLVLQAIQPDMDSVTGDSDKMH